jgi:hypothetical protein
MRKVIIFLIICLTPVITVGQNGYIVKDSLMIFGVKIKDYGSSLNQRICTGTNNGKEFRYNPYELKEYAIKDNKVYISKEITLGDSTFRVFLERKVNGNVNLYYFREKGITLFFTGRGDDKLTELPKIDKDGIGFQNKLGILTSDCHGLSEATRWVRYTPNSLSLLIDRYNHCDSRPFPHFKYGIIAGYGLAKLYPSESIEYSNLQPDDILNMGMPLLGGFVDNPILVSDFSVHAELFISSGRYYFSRQSGDADFHLLGRLTTVSFPLMVRLTLHNTKLYPYFNAGIIQSFVIKDDYSIYDTKIHNTYIEINKYDYNTNPTKMQSGLVIGMGSEYKLSMKNHLSLELRYNRFFESKNSGSFSESGIYIITSISFQI